MKIYRQQNLSGKKKKRKFSEITYDKFKRFPNHPTIATALKKVGPNQTEFSGRASKQKKLRLFVSRVKDEVNFRLYRKGRPTRGGGVVVYVADHISTSILDPVTVRENVNTADVESIWMEINIRTYNSLIGVIYRVPNVAYARLNLIEEVLVEYSMKYHTCIITFDLNKDFLMQQ
ncbi:hypothetical protein HHI36_010273 [Cryptolaemus montrouzieri]|uniref:Uncharacterized protein n=1 Tax=Cryptolaemus montrouzieri TaxID=559131 RepID=A0ABD2MID6_9CUCU